jgi:hypothetical protein
MTAQQTIDAIDLLIDANRRELYRRIRYLPQTAHEYQNAWDRNPDLHAREHDLYRQRGFAQQHLADEMEVTWRAGKRRARAAQRQAA